MWEQAKTNSLSYKKVIALIDYVPLIMTVRTVDCLDFGVTVTVTRHKPFPKTFTPVWVTMQRAESFGLTFSAIFDPGLGFRSSDFVRATTVTVFPA
jgi:hypothetical protein